MTNDPDLPAADALALLTLAQTAAIDAAGDVPGWMRNAGRAVARIVAATWRPCPVLVACGPGANGGDGYVAAHCLQRMGWPVKVAALAPPRPGSAAADAARLWTGPVVAFAPAEAARAALVVDAVFGAGLSRTLPGAVATVLRAAKQVVAVDVPSGLDGATGLPRGEVTQAALTVSLSWLRPGHLLLPGRALCGTLRLADIGIPRRLPFAVDCWRNAPGLWQLPELAPGTSPDGADSHKYSRGAVCLVGGAAMTGATRLAAGAARRAGAGLVMVVAETGADLYRVGDPGLIVEDAPLAALAEDPRRRVWVCGPGLPPEAAGPALHVLLDAGRHVVADAGALAACAGDPGRLRGVRVATPHMGEFARVFGRSTRQADWRGRLHEARDAAAGIGAVLVLKGADTVIAAPDGRAAINADAPPVLATAGAGDVLSGIVGALLARDMPAFDAACAAVWLHGRAAALARDGGAGDGMIAEDVAPHVPAAWAQAVPGARSATGLVGRFGLG